jgi:hypothetical protein
MLGRFIWNPIGALIIGTLAVGLGSAIAFAGVDVSCRAGSPVMAESVSCVSRAGKTMTYADWKSQQQQYSMVAFGFGGLLLCGGAIAFAVRRKRRAAVAV